jgi:outer membrane protein assembly factor BamB
MRSTALPTTRRLLPRTLTLALAFAVFGGCEPDRNRLYITGSATADEPAPAARATGDAAGTLSTVEQRAAGVPTSDDEFAKLGFRRQWRGFPVMLPGAGVREFALLGDIVGVLDSKGIVTILEAGSGAQRWSDEAGGELTKFVGMVRIDKRIILSSESQAIIYDAATGSILDKQRLDRVVNTRPAVVGELLVYGTSSGEVLGQLTRTGYRLWGAGLTGAVSTPPIPVGDDGTIGVVSDGGSVLLVQGGTGIGVGRNRMFAGSSVELASSDELLFVASVDQSLYAFSKNGGVQVWRIRTEYPLRHAPTYHDGVVYADLGPGKGLSAVVADTGVVKWSNEKVSGSVVGLRNKRLVAFDGAGNAATLDPATGKTVETATLPGMSILKTDAFVDGALYAIAPAGVVTKLIPR